MANGLQATFGLLLLSLAVPTALAEERARGSLNVLMTTPLSTESIVMAKWRGAFRIVPALAVLPAIGSVIVAFGAPDLAQSMAASRPVPAPIDAVDRIAYACLPVAMFLAQGAAVVSVGLALATWVRRVGRAIAMSVTIFACMAFGWIFVVELGPEILVQAGLVPANDRGSIEFIAQVVATACPLGGQLCTFATSSWSAGQSHVAFYVAQLMVLLATVGFALIVLALTAVTFDRCAGRVPERPRRAPRPPRKAAIGPKPHVRPADVPHTAASKAMSLR
jgi:ABC-type Na+ efflux pump permease subunit